MSDPAQSAAAFIEAAADTLGLDVRNEWKENVRQHLLVCLHYVRMLEAVELPDDAEPGPVFDAFADNDVP
jgi:hypothetical protein